MVRASHNDQQLRVKQSIDSLPLIITAGESRAAALAEDAAFAEKNDQWDVTVGKNKFAEADTDKANTALIDMVKQIPLANTSVVLGKVNGFSVKASQQYDGFRLILKGESGLDHVTSPILQDNIEKGSADVIKRALNQIKGIARKQSEMAREVQKNKDDLQNHTTQANKPFDRGDQLERMQAELTEIETRLQNLPEDEVKSTETVGAFSVR